MEFYNQFNSPTKSDAVPISSHNFFAGADYAKKLNIQKSKLQGVDIGRVYDFYKRSSKLDYYNTLAGEPFDSMGELGSIYVQIFIAVLDDYLESISGTKLTTLTKLGYTISSSRDPYSAAEIFDSEGNLINPADLRAGMVPLEDINYDLTKYL